MVNTWLTLRERKEIPVYTLGEASKATGMSKAALSKAIAKGRISAQKDETGRFQIDPAELHRVYPPINTEKQLNEQERTQETASVNRELKAKYEAVAELLEQVKGERDELRKDRDEWRRQATALLGTPPQKEAKKGFFARFFRS
jgi:hypothetical protein